MLKICLLLIVAVALAFAPTPPTVSDTWNSNIFMNTTHIGSPSHFISLHASLSHGNGQRIDAFTPLGPFMTFDSCNAKTAFEYLALTETCNTRPLNCSVNPFFDDWFAFLPYSKFVGKAPYGNSEVCDMWEVNSPDGNEIVVAGIDGSTPCFLVTIDKKNEMEDVFLFYDFVPSVQPDWLNIPRACSTASASPAAISAVRTNAGLTAQMQEATNALYRMGERISRVVDQL